MKMDVFFFFFFVLLSFCFFLFYSPMKYYSKRLQNNSEVHNAFC